MSSRALRKARELELLKTSTSDPTPAEASESEDEPVPAQKPSLFALLNIANERNPSDEEAEEEEEEEEEEEPEPEPEPLKPVAKKSKKKKKKKKGKGKARAGEEDDIDRALRQLNLSTPKNTTTSTLARKSVGEPPLSSVLKIDSRHLDAGNEMKKLFGKDALRLDGGDGQGEGGGRRRVPAGRLQLVPGTAGGRSLNKGRRNTFVQPKEEWPNVGSGGLGMEIDKDIEDSDSATGVTTYRFVHSRAYQSVQREFMICVASMGMFSLSFQDTMLIYSRSKPYDNAATTQPVPHHDTPPML
jgi:hypothetical protein